MESRASPPLPPPSCLLLIPLQGGLAPYRTAYCIENFPHSSSLRLLTRPFVSGSAARKPRTPSGRTELISSHCVIAGEEESSAFCLPLRRAFGVAVRQRARHGLQSNVCPLSSLSVSSLLLGPAGNLQRLEEQEHVGRVGAGGLDLDCCEFRLQ